MDSAGKANKSKNYNPPFSLTRYLPDQKGGTSIVPAERRGITCCVSAYPELKSL